MSEFYIDGYLKANLDIIKTAIKDDWDMVFVVDGEEGSGKSVLAMQCAKYCDSSFDISRECFDAESFEKCVRETAQQYQSIVFDEAFGGLSSRAVMSKVNRSLVRMMTEIRAKNLFIFVVLPTFFDLDKYVALWRSRALLHVYSYEGFKRGRFMFFNSERKKQLYVNGKKFYNYNNPKANFLGSFINHYPIDKDAYKKRKMECIRARNDKDNEPEDTTSIRDNIIYSMYQKGIKYKEIGEIVGLDASRICQIVNSIKKSIEIE